jgi:alpha-amylase/alpha-mannosidase (GH57 family)
MAAEPPLSVLFLWHQHQPLYKDGLKNRYELPWVRLHATKDYLDMVTLLDEFPRIKATFNLVPSLLAQLDDYAENKAQDRFLEVTLKAASDLTFDDRQFILQNFFMAHWEHMIDPYPRYRELLDKRGRAVTPESLSRAHTYFKEQDWRDLQTWFNLTWFDPLWKEKDPFIKGLFEKGKFFSEEDKKTLVDRQLEVCRQVVAKHKEMQDKGRIELTTTPFYHPILPLLCDTEVGRTAIPHMKLPAKRFQHPEDARAQLDKAVADYTRRFGRAPAGLWPSEGSVSEEAAAHMMDVGLRWIATDEGVLAKSLEAHTFTRESLYTPYRYSVGGKTIHLFFRDHELSDAIGFVYASWDPETAAKDFVKRLLHIRSSLKDKSRPAVVSVILDGENCWEYYKQDGLPFLRALYALLSNTPELTTVKASEFLDRNPDLPVLPRLWPGSWINSNFAIWIGHSEDNAAWDFLSRTRQFLHNTLQSTPDLKDSPQAALAWEEIYIAEGSDWCWWYGEDHSSANDQTFDYLFRKHLMNVYTLLGGKIPDDLHTPIKRKKVTSEIIEPADFLKPTIDGKVTGYFEWRAAGQYHTEAGTTGTMQKAENIIKTIYYGFDLSNIYLRIDTNRAPSPEFLATAAIHIKLAATTLDEVKITFDQTGKASLENCVFGKVLELALPLKSLQNPDKKDFEITIQAYKDGLEQERWPAETSIKIPYPTENTFAFHWQA